MDNDDEDKIAVLQTTGFGDPIFKHYIWRKDQISDMLQSIETDLEFIEDCPSETMAITIKQVYMTQKELDALPKAEDY